MSALDEIHFLGLDCSTQALKASIVSSSLKLVTECEIRFDRDLPSHKTKDGVHVFPGGVVNSPIMMLVEAIDLLMEKMKAQGIDFKKIKGISGAGQQHASVYWSEQASSILSNLDPTKTLGSQMKSAFSRSVVPNWQDSSTLKQCKTLEDAIGGTEELTKITGSKAHRRFTGAQILKFRLEDPESYSKTSRISLVSSWLCTMFSPDDGIVKGIDESDVCGMNLYDLRDRERKWNQKLLETVSGGNAEELKNKLGQVEKDCGRVVGKIGKWYVERYGFDPEAIVCPFTGDNPATFLSFYLEPSEAIISLGTSDTVLLSTQNYFPRPDFHLFAHPASNGKDHAGYMAMLCYKNGSLAREWVRDKYCNKSWEEFDRHVEEAYSSLTSDADESLGYYFLKPEIIPTGAHGVHRYISSHPLPPDQDFPSPSTNAHSILQSQFLSFRFRTSELITHSISSDSDQQTGITPSTDVEVRGEGVEADELKEKRLRKVFAVGGAANNRTIIKVLSTVLGSPIYKPLPPSLISSSSTISNPSSSPKPTDANSCSVGAAYKAVWSFRRSNGEDGLGYLDMLRECKGVDGGNVKVEDADEERWRVYAERLKGWKRGEDEVLRLSVEGHA